MKNIALLFFLTPAGPLGAEPALRVYSEFSRIDPSGAVVPADRGRRSPREILSPLVPRNGWSSFHVVVSGEPGMAFELHAGQNPENAVRINAYQEVFEKSGDGWLPDALKPVKLPVADRLPGEGVPGQKVMAYWLDIWTEGTAAVRRIKVEPQLWVNDRWIIYPMEVRVAETRIPRHFDAPASLPAAGAPSDAAAWNTLAFAFCSVTAAGRGEPAATVRAMIRRNGLQDLALMKAVPEAARKQALSLAGGCPGKPDRAEFGAEWYLRLRDVLLRTGVQP